ncbi:MAG: hypothetical protein H6942_03785 [Candidatus Accumulibacter sp.]|uniref:hypothetical protein n=1 Tax=Accumulibacter sp. TaxID=2053492 RepID=UPI0025DE2B1B|nr:hypothetical protein [Accumulibacter sp.]MCP5247659.1 hypothetical protein [Accumulibacter sp.]
MNIIACLLLLVLLNGCSTGRYYKAAEQSPHPQIEHEDIARVHALLKSCKTPNKNLDQYNVNTVFVHPGMLWFDSDCGKSITVDSARILIRHGYAKDFCELCDRNPARIGELMQKGPGTRFIGLHYSLGGQPPLVAASLAAVAQAKRESEKALVYYPVLVDPFDIEQFNTLLDLNAAHLGQMFIVLSAEYSLLRPNVSGLREDILNSPKVHLIYAEDFGETWGHFDELASVVKDDVVSRFRDIYFLIAEAVVNGYSAIEFEGRLALLKIKYAGEDARMLNVGWLRLAEKLPCAQRSALLVAGQSRTP